MRYRKSRTQAEFLRVAERQPVTYAHPGEGGRNSLHAQARNADTVPQPPLRRDQLRRL